MYIKECEFKRKENGGYFVDGRFYKLFGWWNYLRTLLMVVVISWFG